MTQKLTQSLFYPFLISLPFGTRILLHQFTTGFHEYEAIFLYASDVFLVLFLLFYFTAQHSHILKNVRMLWREQWPLWIFTVLAGISIFWATDAGLAVYNFGRLILLVLMALAVGSLLRQRFLKLESILAVIAGSAVLQSIIGFIQFIKQSSLGLGWLGESVLGPTIGGSAKIVVDGAPILRAYGTFPHPNVLAAFLVIGLISLYYLFLQNSKHEARNPKQYQNSNDQNNKTFRYWNLANSNLFRISIFGFSIFVILLGLLLTFSRTAWFIAILLTLLAIGYWLFSKSFRRPAIFLVIILFSIFYILYSIFFPYISPRAQLSVTEPAVSYRLDYNRLGLDLIKDKPLGVGIGNQVLYSVREGVYQKFGMDQPWQWQPIHNIYLLMASEIGVAGLLVFVIFIIGLFLNSKSEARSTKQYQNSNDQNNKTFRYWNLANSNLFRISNFEFRISIIMLVALLLFGMVDHFLWTLWPGRIMLWLVMGLVLAFSISKSPHSN